MWQVLLAEFWEDLRSQRTRVMLTCIGIACGTFIVVVLLALGEGIKRSVMSELLGAFDESIVVSGGSTNMPYRGLPARRRIVLQDDDAAALLRDVPDLVAATAVFHRWGVHMTVPGRRSGEDVQVQGVDPSYALMKDVSPAPGGRFLNDRDLTQRRRVAFLADSLARVLFPAGDALGNTVRLNNQSFTVVGVAPRRVQTGVEIGGEHDLVIIPSTTFMTVYNQRTPSQIVVRARNPQDSEAAQAGLRRVLSERHRFDPDDQFAVYVQDWAENARTAWRVLTGIQVFMGLVGGLTLLVAAVGVANIMYVAVKERTLEIGIKLALGARSRHIVAQFVFEAVLLSIAGGLIGLAGAGIAVVVMNGFDPQNEALQYLLRPVISWNIGFATVLILAIIGFAAGVFPARRAAALDPVESLRYE